MSTQTRRGNFGNGSRSGVVARFWHFALLLCAIVVQSAQATGLAAQRGDPLEGKVAWNAGVTAAPNGLIIDSRAAETEADAQARAKSAAAPKALINPGSLSGLWFDPAQDGHGFNFTFSERATGNDLFAVTWYVYRNGAQVWLSGAGEVVGNSATAQVVITSGGQFPPLFNPATVSRPVWGTISITVLSCSRIEVSWQPIVSGYSSGSLVAQPIVVSGGTGANACQVTGTPPPPPPPPQDDHGNSCATATAAVVPGAVSGTINAAGDVDVFRINLGAATTLAVQSSGITTLDPIATLFDANCNPLETDDDDGEGLNFLITRAVPAGTYFLGVAGFGNVSTGSYSVGFATTGGPPPATVTLLFNNRLAYDVTARANGTTLGSVAAGGSRSFVVNSPSPLDVRFDLVRPTLGGTPLGEAMAGIFTPISNPTGTITFNIDNVIGTQPYFVPIVSNNTSARLLMGVNMGLLSENRCNCVVPAFQQNTQFGYYRLFSNSNVRGYRDGSNYTGPFIFWNVSSAESLTGIVRLRADSAP